MISFSASVRVRARWICIVGLAVAMLLVAANNSIQIISTNKVSGSTSDHRWEPSSAAGTTWLTSWEDLNVLHGLTSTWNSGWSTPFLHTSPSGNNTGDLFALYNPVQPADNLLVMLDLVNLSLVFRRSTDSTGSSWNAPVAIYPIADYPSVAVSSSGTIVVGFNATNGSVVFGYQTMVSTNGGQSWTGPFVVTNSGFQAFGRVVWSSKSNEFHVLFVDKSSSPTYYLKRAQSSNGASWSIVSTPIDTYTAPAPISPTSVVNGNYIYYATTIDAAAASGLGWVVAYPVARTDNPGINNVKYCAETLGCSTISYPNDLFMQGITTSSSSDVWLNLFTYSSPSSRTVPLKQLAVYRTSAGSYLSGFVNPPQGIDPTSWALYGGSRCTNGSGQHSCYAMGDYDRPAMNPFTAASLPFVGASTRTSDLNQIFVQDPATGVPPVPGLEVGPAEPFGMNSTYTGVLPAAFALDRQPSLESSVQFLLSAAGR